MPSPSSLFRRTSSRTPAAVLLFLIENSARMERRWEKLREDHLEPLLGMFEEANKDIPVQVITLEGTPVGGEGPRVYPSARESLRGIRFNPVQENKLTVDKVERAAELLGSFRYKGQAVDSHLLVVAATDPSPEVPPGIKQYPWFLAAKRVVAHGALCHLALVKDDQDISPFVNMFQNTLWLQSCIDVPAPFDYDSATLVFHFCTKSSGQDQTSRGPPERTLLDTQDDGRIERSRCYSGDASPPEPNWRRTGQDQDTVTHPLTHYDGISFRSAGTRSRLSSSSAGVRPESVSSRSPSRTGIARLSRDSIQLPSVPEVPNFGLSPYTVDPSASSTSSQPRAQPTRRPPPPGRSSSFIDEIFAPNSRRDTHPDVDEDTEPFWMEGRVLEEALMRYEKDGAK